MCACGVCVCVCVGRCVNGSASVRVSAAVNLCVSEKVRKS